MGLIEQIKANALVPERYDGPIPLTVPAIRADGRHFAGGTRILQEILDIFILGDRKKVKSIEHDYTDLSDASFNFEDEIIVQLDSPFLTGIRGVVRTQDGLYVAVDAEAVQSVIDKSKAGEFKVRGTETVEYTRDKQTQKETVSNVVLFPYNGKVMEFTPAQLNAITGNVYRVKRDNITCNEDFTQDQMVKDGKVLQFPWNAYPADIIVPLIEGGVNQEKNHFDGVFAYNKSEHNYDTNMGFFPADAPTSNNAEMRALCVDRLDGRFRLCGDFDLGLGGSHLVGVGDKSAVGAARYIRSPLEELAGKAIEVGNGLMVIRQDQISPQAHRLLTQKG